MLSCANEDCRYNYEHSCSHELPCLNEVGICVTKKIRVQQKPEVKND